MKITLACLAFLGLIVAANLSLTRWGLVEIGPWLVPAGVWAAGLTFGVRDYIHERRWQVVIGLILVGALLSWWLESAPKIAVASGVAFLVSESADMLVYEPLRRRDHRLAALVSNGVGSAIDSALFLHLAFGGMAGFTGLFVTKWAMVLPFLLWRRRG